MTSIKPEPGTTPVDQTSPTTGTKSDAKPGTDLATTQPTGPLVSDQGRTSISDTVVAKIAGIATREVTGVHDLGGGTARAVGALRERIPGSKTNLTQGVGVEVGERQTAIDLEIVVDYGVPIAELAKAIRAHVIESVETMTGLQVTEVNITVLDVFLPEDGAEDDTDTEPRVQ